MRAVPLPIDMSLYPADRLRMPNGDDGATIKDQMAYDHLPPEVRKALRESPCLVTARDVYVWLAGNDIETGRAVRHIAGLAPVGSGLHWKFMNSQAFVAAPEMEPQPCR